MSRLSTITAAAVALLSATPPTILWAQEHHEHHASFSAGEPGDAQKPARTVKVAMVEKGDRMLFEPARVEVRRGEQIRFVVSNEGIFNHEFVLATVAENRKHAAAMKKQPHMEHKDPNALTVAPYVSGELIWRFTKKGEFEFGCLRPGHYEAGMHGTVVVK